MNKTYKVVGTRAVSGVKPGGTVSRDPNDPATLRLLNHGRIALKPPAKVGDKEQSDG